MREAEWKTLLDELSRLALAEDKDRDPKYRLFSPVVHASGYLGYEGASNEFITMAEDRLGVEFPLSYKSFLRISNGWPPISSECMPGRLWPVQEVYWIRDNDPYTLKSWGEVSDPLEDISPEKHLHWRGRDTVNYRVAYVKNLLSISDHGDACDLLLSPEVVDEQGEWECWHIASWYPGASRHHSFEAWMKDQYQFMSDRTAR